MHVRSTLDWSESKMFLVNLDFPLDLDLDMISFSTECF